jgi:hypothetical protein
MAALVGGSKAFPGDDNVLVGTDGPDVIFGDAHTAGATPFFPDVPAMGGALAAGTGATTCSRVRARRTSCSATPTA